MKTRRRDALKEARLLYNKLKSRKPDDCPKENATKPKPPEGGMKPAGPSQTGGSGGGSGRPKDGPTEPPKAPPMVPYEPIGLPNPQDEACPPEDENGQVAAPAYPDFRDYGAGLPDELRPPGSRDSHPPPDCERQDTHRDRRQ